uniref:Uncharacterized protein n=1 Tax=Fundulus heteroclitus TaxID=8078 RepID=A0A3Q2PPY1_FUNHE
MSAGFSKKLTSACSVSSEARIWAAPSDGGPCPAAFSSHALACSRWPASPICSTRLVTVAMAWNRSFSSGSPWNMLYSVLQNWMNSRWERKEDVIFVFVLRPVQTWSRSG